MENDLVPDVLNNNNLIDDNQQLTICNFPRFN